MNLTRMKLNDKKPATMMAFSKPDMFHGAVESAFEGERKRRLWRLDRLNGEYYLMIVSEDKPDLTHAAEQFGFPEQGWETKDYDPLLDRIKTGDYLRFRLAVNPVVYRDGDGKKHGKRYACVTAEQQTDWLRQRAPSYGFSVDSPRCGCGPVYKKWNIFRKKAGDKNNVRILNVVFEGVLKVTDEDLFRQTLCKGIGRGKAYGQGLLTVAGL